ncbi:MAG: hypothetical protein O3B24_11650, partial [Verrucomicrobia bacterium]|nr:hypothetical protein [Verrucomicrobiota bacterium]
SGWLAAAAVAAGISVWCKQTMVPLLPALVLWLLAQRQWGRALTLAGLLGAVGALLAGISLWIAPVDALWLNLVTIPRNCEWTGQFPYSLLKALLDLARMGFIAVPLLAAGAVLGACMLPSPAFRDWIRRGAWLPALLVAVLMVPVSLVGIVKVGGALNAFGPTHYFLFAAAVLQWVELAAAAGRGDGATLRARGALAWGMAACWWAVAGLWLLQSMQELRYGLYDPRQSLCHKAYVYLTTDNVPRAYFPAYPLAHLLAEDRLYHFVHGMADRDQAGRVPIGDEQREAHLPADTDVVCWTTRQFGSEHGRGQAYFPAFTRPRPVPALPDFTCFVAEKPTP